LYCIDELFDRRLRKLVEGYTAEDFINDRFWMHALRDWAASVTLTIIDIENRHARCKAYTCRGTPTLQMFCASYVVDEARRLVRMAQGIWDLIDPPRKAVQKLGDATAHFLDNIKNIKRSLTPLDVLSKLEAATSTVTRTRRAAIAKQLPKPKPKPKPKPMPRDVRTHTLATKPLRCKHPRREYTHPGYNAGLYNRLMDLDDARYKRVCHLSRLSKKTRLGKPPG
jgi:hypothetical protein